MGQLCLTQAQKEGEKKRRTRRERERMEGGSFFYLSGVPYCPVRVIRYSMVRYGGTIPEAAVSHFVSIHSSSTTASSTHPSFQARVSYRALWISALMGRVGSSKAVAVWVQCQCTPGSDHNREDFDPEDIYTFFKGIDHFYNWVPAKSHPTPTLPISVPLSRAIRDARDNTPGAVSLTRTAS
ncbi:hypothetical protein BDW42DRAFT_93434 [Aspergillus taichungensis]|uniref:Uncharacterized protein n=1 Tax=Aspergillus taichungensis TaxID=482145 RepID=A0A2J5I8W4_9EURO|nr:hypothetical protein BDW42DRAFT_93434 [Aspergillus taichungensis]